MAAVMVYTNDPDLLQNDTFSVNMTAANTSSIYTASMSPLMDKTINILLIIVVFITMVSLGCTMEVSKIKVPSETLILKCTIYVYEHNNL